MILHVSVDADVWIMHMYMTKSQRIKYFYGVLKIWCTFLLHLLSSGFFFSIRDFTKLNNLNESCMSEFCELD